LFFVVLVVGAFVSMHNFFQRNKLTNAFLLQQLRGVEGWLWQLLQAALESSRC